MSLIIRYVFCSTFRYSNIFFKRILTSIYNFKQDHRSEKKNFVLNSRTKAQKIEAEKNRLDEVKRKRMKSLQEEQRSMKTTDISNSSHMKLALQKTGSNTNRRYVNVVRQPGFSNPDTVLPSMDALRNQKNVLDAFMIKMCMNLEPWKEVCPPFTAFIKLILVIFFVNLTVFTDNLLFSGS